MIALMRLLIFGFILLTGIYLGLSWYSRSVRRRKMTADWEDAGRPGDRDAYIETGMAQYERSLRRRLIWLVYVVPVTAVAVIIYVTNFR
ncbi:hypothetical protein SAMN05443999_10274 [Roseovarius azorensis]|uniref:Cation/multidrug efflux pump n=1 Tax=Roseovarius azorensis TaxID=1287727 RepID=A0A1H7J791_9RHOB|nr:hypothetical protein [Roseovarius azorensis]SEK69015.1 hypothetical protein SAMN05443999_10274 [Roseovarius azorensis]